MKRTNQTHFLLLSPPTRYIVQTENQAKGEKNEEMDLLDRTRSYDNYYKRM